MSQRLRFATFNVHDYAKPNARSRDDEVAHRDRIHQVIAEMDVDVLAVQEICGDAATRLTEIARATGMDCYTQQPWISDDDADAGDVAVAASGGDPYAVYNIGLLWRPGIKPVPSTWRSYDGEFWHNLCLLTLDVDGTRIRVGSYHGPPFGRERRADEAERVVSALLRPYGSTPAGIVGGDWNSISADRVRVADGTWGYYHPDPYAEQPWQASYIYQCQWELDPGTGLPARWWADRRPGETLWAGVLRDTAALSGGPWQRTAGHHVTDGLGGDRAIDTLRVTGDLAGQVVAHEVVDTELTRQASDHLPVVTEIEL